MRGEEFHIILPSNSSMRYFPENKTTCFTTELPQRIDLSGRWKVALTEIQFPHSFLHIRPGEGTIQFLNARRKNEQIIPEIIPDAEVPSGVYPDVGNVIEMMNYASKLANSHIVWELKVGDRVVMKLSCEEKKCDMVHFVYFSDKLCRILGFDVDAEERSRLLFPSFLFALENDEFILADKPASLMRGIPDKLFVYCDICEPHITGDVQSPLLRIVALDARNDYSFASNQISHFSPAQYIALRQTCFRTIEIDIRDQLEEGIPFEFGTLTVTLHFRRID